MNARKLIPAILTALCGLIVSTTPALAAQHHAFSQSFGSPGAGAGQLSLIGYRAGTEDGSSGLAVDDATHDVYVADTGNGRVDEFDPSKPSGEQFVRAWGWGVADGKAELETCTATCQAGLAGSDPGQFSSPFFIAVDNSSGPSSGDVYVADTYTGLVTKFTATGELVTSWGVSGQLNGSTSPGGPFSGIAGIAIGASGNLFVLNRSGQEVGAGASRMSVFDQGGASLEDFTLQFPAKLLGFALDNSNGPSSGDIYTVFWHTGIETLKFSPAGLLEGEPDVEEGRGLAVDSSSGDLYVSHAANIASYDPSGGSLEKFGSAEPAGGELQGPAGLAVDPSDHTVYVADAGSQRIDAFASVPFPGVSTTAAGNLQPESATLNGILNPGGTTPDTEVTNCQFEYVEDATFKDFTGVLTTAEIFASFGATTPCLNPDGATTAPLAPDTVDHAVHADVIGLQAGTAYDVRLSATNANGTEASSPGAFSTLFPFVPPTIESVSAFNVSSASADLEAQIDPNHYAASYRFEYVDNATYEQDLASGDGFQHASRAPAGAEAVSSPSGVSQAVQQPLLNLDPGTTYRYRLAAGNGYGGLQTSAVQTFTTQITAPFLLPDGRGWEMVSQPDKRGAVLEAIGARGGADIQASADGSAITYAAQSPIDADPQGNRNIAVSQIFSRRTVGGWSSQEIATPNDEVTGTEGSSLSEYQLFSPDLSVGLLEPAGDTPLSPQATEETPYRRETNGEYTPLVTAANVPAGTKFGQVEERSLKVVGDVAFAGASPDLSHIVLTSAPPLTEGIADPDAKGIDNLFEWAGGSLRLVSVLPNGKAATEEGNEGAFLGFPVASGSDVRHAVSDDGSRVFWQAQGSNGPTTTALYMRDVSRGETVKLDAVQAGAPGGGVEQSSFSTASSDGSRVFFTSAHRLTLGSSVSASDLYMCEINIIAGKSVCRLKDLTVDLNAGEAADVHGTVIGASEDGRYAYFAASGVLAAGASPEHCVEGADPDQACNLYVYDAAVDKVKFVARLSDENFRDWGASSPAALTAGVSPDGRYLAFMSEVSLTGYDNIDARSGQPDVEVFLYDAVTGRLTCASCNPSGARPSGVFDPGNLPGLLVDRGGFKGANWDGHWLAGSIPSWTTAAAFASYYRSRYLSDSGRLFFDSADALVPSDANGTEDVYEYEPSGVGSCAREGGCVGLISSGGSGEESAFLDASENGNDAFFLTAAQLSPADNDHALDVYDAHVCTSESPCASPPAPSPPACEGDACQNPVAPPNDMTPGSFTFHGPGDITPLVSKPVVKPKAKPLTRAQKLAKALKACKKDKSKKKRSGCEKKARKLYGRGK
jgi:DNA-binding beta-propeller fold protein YncE